MPGILPDLLGFSMKTGLPRVLLVHNRYQQRGGEDLAFEAESALLQAHGHDVETLTFSNDAIPERRSLVEDGRLALQTVWSREGVRTVQERARQFRPDVVHFHNTFPLVSPAAFRAARGSGAAVVTSLHNYRLVCPSADLFRDGQGCTDCLGRRVPWPGVQHGCYRDSRMQTAVVASMLGFHNLRRSWSRDIDLFLTPSQAAAELLQSGVPSDRLRVKPNFITDEVNPPPPDATRSGFLFVGRLTVEKGILVLLEAWRRHAPGELTIVGDGPLRWTVEEAARDQPLIHVAGETDRAGVMRAMGDAAALIVPSVWQEPFGLVVIEAFASETPVIAARSGALPELIEHKRSGLLYEATDPDDLADAVGRGVEDPALMRQFGRHGRQVYLSRYSAAANYGLLLKAYEEALDRRSDTNRP